MQDFDETIRLSPDYAGAFYNKACCYGVQGMVSEAVVWLRKALELDREKYCKLAKDESDFDGIGEETPFKELMREHCDSQQ
jgi:tetratricopeptide (TPR) repeat protein